MIFLLIAICILLAALLGGSWYVYKQVFFSTPTGEDFMPGLEAKRYDPYRDAAGRGYAQLLERPCEWVSVISQDGRRLSGRYYHVQDGAPLEIGFHGYRSSAIWDFSGISSMSFSMNHNLLLVDQRAHGRSEGRTIAFGIQERWDVLSWIDYAINRFGADTKILLLGVSMGAATVLMASELELPDNVRGIVADCPYSTPRAIIRKVASSKGLSPALILPLAVLGAKLYGGFDLCEADPVRAVKHAAVPTLLIHGEADGFVPCEMSEEIFHSNPEKLQRFTFPGADHGFSYLSDSKKYQEVFAQFVQSVL